MRDFFQTLVFALLLGGFATNSIQAAESSAVIAAPAGDDVLTVSFIEKPPYYFTTPEGLPAGFLLERTRRVLDEAGVSARFVSVPAKRVLADIEAGRSAACAIGWFKTPDRERFARFSMPLYRDLPLVLVARRGAAVIGTSLFDILGNEKLKIGVVAGYSYGEKIDAALQRVGPRVETLGNPEQTYRFLTAGRADVALFNREEFNYFAERYPDLSGALMRIDLADVPPGELRYLMCSNVVKPQVIERINAAILRLESPPAKGSAARR